MEYIVFVFVFTLIWVCSKRNAARKDWVSYLFASMVSFFFLKHYADKPKISMFRTLYKSISEKSDMAHLSCSDKAVGSQCINEAE